MLGTRRRRVAHRLLGLLLIAGFLLAGCGGDDDGGGSDDSTTTSAAAADSSTTTAGGDASTTTTPGGDASPDTTTAAGGPGAAALGDVAAQLGDADLGCDTVEGQRSADGAQGAAQCDLSTDRPAYLYTFDDNDQRDAFIDGSGVIDCTFLFGSGVTFDYVIADQAIIRPEDNEDADAIADAVDGEVRTISCELPDEG